MSLRRPAANSLRAVERVQTEGADSDRVILPVRARAVYCGDVESWLEPYSLADPSGSIGGNPPIRLRVSDRRGDDAKGGGLWKTTKVER